MQVRVEQVLMSSPSLLLCFRLSHLLAFYNSTIRNMLDEEAQLVQMLKVLLLLIVMMMVMMMMMMMMMMMVVMMMMVMMIVCEPISCFCCCCGFV